MSGSEVGTERKLLVAFILVSSAASCLSSPPQWTGERNDYLYEYSASSLDRKPATNKLDSETDYATATRQQQQQTNNTSKLLSQSTLAPPRTRLQNHKQLQQRQIGSQIIAPTSNNSTKNGAIQNESVHLAVDNSNSKGGDNLVNIYERLVSIGSTVRLSCPHAIGDGVGGGQLSLVNVNANDNNRHSNGLPKEADNNNGNKKRVFAGGERNSERIKWFKNHVPLDSSINHEPADGSTTPSSLSSSLPVDKDESGAEASLVSDKLFRFDDENEELTKLNRIDETQKVSSSLSSRRSFELHRKRSNLSDLLSHESNEDDVGVESDSEDSEDRIVDSSRNLIDLRLERQKQRRRRRRALVTNWYVSPATGELVIRRITPRMAGKYTCLYGGRQSELVLDVLGVSGGAETDTRSSSRRRKYLRHSAATHLISDSGAASLTTKIRRRSAAAATRMSNGGQEHSQPQLPVQQYQQRPAHVIVDEALAGEDLASIIGILYTKQQLHCPIELLLENAMAAAEKLAANANNNANNVNNNAKFGPLKQPSGRGRASSRGDLLGSLLRPLARLTCPTQCFDSCDQVDECATLLERLVLKVAAIDAPKVRTESYAGRRAEVLASRGAQMDLIGSILSVDWLKDGQLLEFDSQTGKLLATGNIAEDNVRLLPETSASTTSGSNSASDEECAESTDTSARSLSQGTTTAELKGSNDASESESMELDVELELDVSANESANQNDAGDVDGGAPEVGGDKKKKKKEPIPIGSVRQAKDKCWQRKNNRRKEGPLAPEKEGGGRASLLVLGRVLEINGLSKENAGRYSCAPRLSFRKLSAKIASLVDPNWAPVQSSQSQSQSSTASASLEHSASSAPLPLGQVTSASGLRQSGCVDDDADGSAGLNDKLCCDSVEIKCDKARATPTKANENETGSRASPRNKSQRNHHRNHHPIIGRLQRALLNETYAIELLASAFSQLDDAIGSPPEEYSIPIGWQTFVVLVTERAANSTNLWTTIQAANKAYQRRKWANFKRIKRELEMRNVAAKSSPLPPAHSNGPITVQGNDRLSDAKLSKLEPIATAELKSNAELNLLRSSSQVSDRSNNNVAATTNRTLRKRSLARSDFSEEREANARAFGSEIRVANKSSEQLDARLSSTRLNGALSSTDNKSNGAKGIIHGHYNQEDNDNNLESSLSTLKGSHNQSSVHRLSRRLRRWFHGAEERPNLLLNNASKSNQKPSFAKTKQMNERERRLKSDLQSVHFSTQPFSSPSSLEQFADAIQANREHSDSDRLESQRPLGTSASSAALSGIDKRPERGQRPLGAAMEPFNVPSESRKFNYVNESERYKNLDSKGESKQRWNRTQVKLIGTNETTTTTTTANEMKGSGNDLALNLARRQTQTAHLDHRRRRRRSLSLDADPKVIDTFHHHLMNAQSGSERSRRSIKQYTTSLSLDSASLQSELESESQPLTANTDQYERSLQTKDQAVSNSHSNDDEARKQPAASDQISSSSSAAAALLDQVASDPMSNSETATMPTLKTIVIDGLFRHRADEDSISAEDDGHEDDAALSPQPHLAADETRRSYNPNPIQSVDSSTIPMSSDDDESILWAASQYVYMHIKAFAASSIYGVQVDVEWSNERANATGASANLPATNFQPAQISSSPSLSSGSSSLLLDVPLAPFATIDVIPGQYLDLQCTAQALGRLPDVRWYKRIHNLPEHLSKSALGRQIGGASFWPLTELHLLAGHKHESFVSSQTSTVFDSLANQTFTVVNSLQLSQYNDNIDSSSAAAAAATSSASSSSSPTPTPSSLRKSDGVYNLYACIVDADVRHNYATLGVHLRRALVQLPRDVSSRLEALKAFPNANSIGWMMRPNPSDQSAATHSNSPIQNRGFSHLHDSSLSIPLRSHWIPIRNLTKSSSASNPNRFNATAPVILSIMIALVFATLIGLLYLTHRAYQNLTTASSSSKDASANTYRETEGSYEAVSNREPPRQMIARSTLCSCQLEDLLISESHDGMELLEPHELHLHLDKENGFRQTCSSSASNTNIAYNLDSYISQQNQDLDDVADIISETQSTRHNRHPSHEQEDVVFFQDDDLARDLPLGCCQNDARAIVVSKLAVDGQKQSLINMFENPTCRLNEEYDDEEIVIARGLDFVGSSNRDEDDDCGMSKFQRLN